MYPDSSFWHGKRVLLTGHTGFKGAWLALWLQRLGAQVTGLAQESLGRNDDAALTLDRLDEHRRRVGGDRRGERLSIAERHRGEPGRERAKVVASVGVV